MNRPNIILIMTDNQPADLLGCYGNKEIHTPHLDKMAENGLLFKTRIAPMPCVHPLERLFGRAVCRASTASTPGWMTD